MAASSHALLLAWSGVGLFGTLIAMAVYIRSDINDSAVEIFRNNNLLEIHRLGVAAWLVIALATATNLMFLEVRRCRTALLVLSSALFWTAGYSSSMAGSGPVWIAGTGLLFPMRFIAWLNASLGVSLAVWWPAGKSVPALAGSLVMSCTLVGSAAALRLSPQPYVLPAASTAMVSLAGVVLFRFSASSSTSALLAGLQEPQAAGAVSVFFWVDCAVTALLVALDIACRFGTVSMFASEALLLCAAVFWHVSLLSATAAGAFPAPEDCQALQAEATRLAELESACTKKDRYMAAITHELRTPLNGIIGLLDSLLLGDANSMDVKHRKSLVTVRDTGKRLNKLIGTILDHASMQEEKLKMANERVNVHKVINETSQLIKPLLSPGTKLSLDISDTLPLIRWDTNRLTQVLFNLMGNAAKFTQQGTITVRTAFDGSELSISVKDTGIGIPEDKLAAVFNPFEQVEDVQGRSFGGTGLGLAMAKKLVEAQGGTIAVESSMGSGTTFIIKLPFTDEKQSWHSSEAGEDSSSTAPGARPAPSRGGAVVKGRENKTGMRDILSTWISKHQEDNGSWMTSNGAMEGLELEVLSVDDDPVNQNVMRELMTASGFKVTIAMEAQEALDILAERKRDSDLSAFPDIIFMDLMMPRITGLEATKIIRKLYPQSSMPIIMVSANDDEESIVQGLQNGCNDYISKPFNRMELIARAGLQIRMLQYYNKEMEAWQHENLLQELLPQSVIDRLKMGQTTIADELPEVSVVMTDIVGFTNVAAAASTPQIIGMLDRLFSDFDAMSEIHGVEKIETRGDSYLVLAGHDEASRDDHVARAIRMALDMIKAASQVTTPSGEPLRIRLGINSGPAYAGIVGHKCPRYCLFGDTVNTASRMESHGFPMCIQISDATYKLAAKTDIHSSVSFTDLGVRNIKGKHQMRTWLVQAGDWKNALAKYLTGQPAEEPEEAPPPAAAAVVPIPVPATDSSSGERLDFLGLQIEELLAIVRSTKDVSAAPAPDPSSVVIQELVQGMEGLNSKLDGVAQDILPLLGRIEEIAELNQATLAEVSLCSEGCSKSIQDVKAGVGRLALTSRSGPSVTPTLDSPPGRSSRVALAMEAALQSPGPVPSADSPRNTLAKRRASLARHPRPDTDNNSRGVSFGTGVAGADPLTSIFLDQSELSPAVEAAPAEREGRTLRRLRSRSLREKSFGRLTAAASATDARRLDTTDVDLAVAGSSLSAANLNASLPALRTALSVPERPSLKQTLRRPTVTKSSPGSPRGNTPRHLYEARLEN